MNQPYIIIRGASVGIIQCTYELQRGRETLQPLGEGCV